MRRLAQHVVGMAPAFGFGGRRARERVLDRTAHDELASKDADRRHDRLPDDRFARPRDETLQGCAKALAVLGIKAGDLPGQHQRPGGRIDEHRIAAAEMSGPVGLGEFVADEAVRRVGIGNAQQRLGETHQHHAFAARQVELVKKSIEPAKAGTPLAHLIDQPARHPIDSCAGVVVDRGRVEKTLDHLAFRGARCRDERRPRRIDLWRYGKDHRWLYKILRRRPRRVGVAKASSLPLVTYAEVGPTTTPVRAARRSSWAAF